MFSYRHAFHAGNHGDVLKHVVLIQLLRYLTRKDGALRVVDTHAGAGAYALDGAWASQREEYRDGIGRIHGRRDAPAAVADYLAVIDGFNGGAGKPLRRYPGSPLIALGEMRPVDRLVAFEAHPTEARVLAGNLATAGRGGSPRRIEQRPGDGFAGLKALLPPPSRRGLVLIDPSYEDKQDYRRVVTTLGDGLDRFATGCFAIWYPLIQRREARQMPATLLKRAPRWLHATLAVRPPRDDGFGLHGSGLIVVNPPWTLAASLETALPWLATALAEPGADGWTLDLSPER